MKRIFSIALLTIFIFSTIGVVASSMTCNMKEMKAKMCCSNKQKDCCEKEVKLLKLKDDFVSPQNQKIVRPLEFSFFSFSPLFAETYFTVQEKVVVTNDLPPPRSTIERLILIQSFLI